MRQATPYLPSGFAFAGVGWAWGDGPARFAVKSAPGIEATAQSFWRAASISKVVVGQTVCAVVARGPPYADVSDLLGWRLRNPRFPNVPITVEQLAGHASGMSDAGGYLVPDGVELADWIGGLGAACFSDAPPGARFEYSNLGYLVMAAVAEAVAGARFDVLAQRHVLDPLKIEAGFNWRGLSADVRAAALPTYRRDGNVFVAQIDETVTVSERAGVAALSPQGGLRISLEGALQLARGLAGMVPEVLMGPHLGEVDLCDGTFESYGWGLQIFDQPAFYPRPLIGHFANAYGFVGSVWYDCAADFAFAVALNGVPIGDESDAVRPEELAIFKVMAEIAYTP